MASWAKQQRIDRYAILQDVFDRDKRHRFTQYAAARWPLSIAMNEFTAAIAWIN